jgi:hypothetical protein
MPVRSRSPALHRKTLTQQGFSHTHGRLLLKRGSRVPSASVRTAPPRRDQSHKLVRRRGPGQPRSAQIHRTAHAFTTTPTAGDNIAALRPRGWRSLKHAQCACWGLWLRAGLETWRVVGGQLPSGAVLLDNRGRDPTARRPGCVTSGGCRCGERSRLYVHGRPAFGESSFRGGRAADGAATRR